MKALHYNQTFYKLNEKQRRKKYDEYCAWFEVQKGTVEGLSALVAGKRFDGWARALATKKETGAYDPKDFTADSWNLFCFNTADPEKLIKAAARNQLRNKEMITEACLHVDGNPDKPMLDPEYLVRAATTKQLRKKLKDYSGSPELASDLLFQFKKDADEQGKDFGKIAQAKIDEMAKPVFKMPETLSLTPPQPRPKHSGIRWFLSRLTGGLISPEQNQGEIEPSKSYMDIQKLKDDK